MSRTVHRLTKADLTFIYTAIRDLIQSGVSDTEVVNRLSTDKQFLRTDGEHLQRGQVFGYIDRLRSGKLHVKLESGKKAPPQEDDLQNALRAVAEAKLSPAFRRRLILFICNKLVG